MERHKGSLSHGILLQVRTVEVRSSVNLQTLSPGPTTPTLPSWPREHYFMGVIYEQWRTFLALSYALMGSAVEPVSF